MVFLGLLFPLLASLLLFLLFVLPFGFPLLGRAVLASRRTLVATTALAALTVALAAAVFFAAFVAALFFAAAHAHTPLTFTRLLLLLLLRCLFPLVVRVAAGGSEVFWLVSG